MSDIKSKTLEVRVKLELNDFLRFNYALYYGRFANMLLNVIGVGALIILSFKGIGGYLPIIVVTFIYLFFIPAIIFFQSRKVMSADKFLQSEQLYTFEDGGIRVSSDSVNTTIKWNQIYRAVSYKHVIAIFLAKNRALIIPARVFDDDDSRLELIKILKKHISERKLKIKK